MIQIGNIFALLALVGYPVVVIVMFRKMSQQRALIWSILGAYMFLPQISAINFPLIPPLNKESIPNLTAFAVCMSYWGRMPNLVPQAWVGRALVAMFLISPAITVFNNMDAIQFGVDRFGSMRLVDPNALELWGLPGLRFYDSGSALVQQIFFMLPFFLAREALRGPDGMREILLALVVAGMIYALPMLYEVRMSPQLHTRLYGFFQHDFAQAMRQGGFRPFVFMPHGLWVAFFAFMVTMAAAGRFRIADKDQAGKRLLMVGFGLFLVVLTKSMGPLLYTLAFVPVILLLKPRIHLTIATMLVTLVIAYPLLRGLELVPTQAILDQVAEISEEREQSLEYRFNNEQRILDHVEERPLFGWGGWGRFMVYDTATGETETIVDGQWIITIGHYGWLGYIAAFGMLALPLYALAFQAARRHAAAVPIEVSTVALILAVNMFDLLPNATLIPFTWLMAGALLGYAEDMKRATNATRDERLRRAHRGVMLGLKRGGRGRDPRRDPGRDPATGGPRTLI
ncbi:hypothetical protein C4N9_02055 [Pararhodobacter marinus]|uniref:O-antigen ligase-related domain-containing protein n=1 Tax=Pararhodobacter marinus TaxID=2184063 RepID=A0A2U2CIU7_9RHOB|nr:O-antigen ligase family protein [Pararhodobacter marinus]PWE31808.1 hypothetical protein C4N9_02055 [Pararhodobacter marinus]